MTAFVDMHNGFFDAYPRFFETGNTPGGRRTRLNARYEMLIDRHRNLIEGRTVLDVASHDGRWGFAALEAGARHVIGVEPNSELVENARRNYEAYGIDPSRYQFHTTDALTFLQENAISVDTVFLFGILYHVHYHVDLIQSVIQTGAREVIIDTNVSPDGDKDRHRNTMSFHVEATGNINTAKVEAVPGLSIAGVPSRKFLGLVFRTFGYGLRELPWDRYLKKWGSAGLKDYAAGERGTFLAIKRASGDAPDHGETT